MNVELVASFVALLWAFPLKLLEFAILSSRFRPDLLSLSAVSLGYTGGWIYGTPAAFAIGLAEDILVGRRLGIRAFSLAVGSIVTGTGRDYLTPDVFVPRAMLSAVAVFLSDLAAMGLLSLVGSAPPFRYFLREIAMPSAVWAALLVLPLTFAVSSISARLWRVLSRMKDGGMDR